MKKLEKIIFVYLFKFSPFNIEDRYKKKLKIEYKMSARKFYSHWKSGDIKYLSIIPTEFFLLPHEVR